MKNGGFIAESKKEIYDLIPQKYYPKTELIVANSPFGKVLKIIRKFQNKISIYYQNPILVCVDRL